MESLETRMKEYENVFKQKFTKRVPLILRFDGKNFSKLTDQNFPGTFNSDFSLAMLKSAKELFTNVPGAAFCYVQSDEISLFIHGYRHFETNPWLGNEMQKILSITTSIVTSSFNSFSGDDMRATFDGRIMLMPEGDVANYFIWRQRDMMRNSVSMLSRSLFPHRALQGVNTEKQKQMCIEKGTDWENIDAIFKIGTCIYRHWDQELKVENFVISENRNLIQRFFDEQER